MATAFLLFYGEVYASDTQMAEAQLRSLLESDTASDSTAFEDLERILDQQFFLYGLAGR